MTNNQLTRERIELIANFHRAMTLPPSHDEIEELARMALAAMNSEPVAEITEDLGRLFVKIHYPTTLKAGDKLYRHVQVAPDGEQLAIENFRSAMEGIGHIRRTLEETFGGLHGTHVEPDVLAECKAICDAIYAAYGHAQAAPVVPEEKPMPNPLSMYAVDAVAAIAEAKGWNACRSAMLQESQKSAGGAGCVALQHQSRASSGFFTKNSRVALQQISDVDWRRLGERV